MEDEPGEKLALSVFIFRGLGRVLKNSVCTVWHEICAGVLFCGLAIFCVLRDLIFAISSKSCNLTNFRNENYNMYRNIISERITQNTDMDESEI